MNEQPFEEPPTVREPVPYAARIKAWRAGRYESNKEIAEMIGVHPQTFYTWQSGQNTPGEANVRAAQKVWADFPAPDRRGRPSRRERRDTTAPPVPQRINPPSSLNTLEAELRGLFPSGEIRRLAAHRFEVAVVFLDLESMVTALQLRWDLERLEHRLDCVSEWGIVEDCPALLFNRNSKDELQRVVVDGLGLSLDDIYVASFDGTRRLDLLLGQETSGVTVDVERLIETLETLRDSLEGHRVVVNIDLIRIINK